MHLCHPDVTGHAMNGIQSEYLCVTVVVRSLASLARRKDVYQDLRDTFQCIDFA